MRWGHLLFVALVACAAGLAGCADVFTPPSRDQLPVMWHEVWLAKDTDASQRILWTQFKANKHTRYTIIAGGIGQSSIDDHGSTLTDHGIHPPLAPWESRYTRGLSFKDVTGLFGQWQMLTIECGYMHVRIEDISHGAPPNSYSRRLPWPPIIRTPSLPAGATSTEYVLLSVPDATNSWKIRETVFRPNQEADSCERIALPDGLSRIGVRVGYGTGPDQTSFFLRSVSYIDAAGDDTRVMPILPVSREADFLRDVCQTVGRVREFIKDDWATVEPRWNAISPPK